jgi:hypothetical protein
MCLYCWYDNLLCIYGVIRLLLVKWYFRMVSPRNLSQYYSGGEDVADHLRFLKSVTVGLSTMFKKRWRLGGGVVRERFKRGNVISGQRKLAVKQEAVAYESDMSKGVQVTVLF